MDTRSQWFLLIIGILALSGVLVTFYYLGKDLESSIYSKVKFAELEKSECMDASCLNDGCIIDSLEGYNNLVKIQSNPVCEQFSLPEIDFSKYVLLGKSAKATGCEQEFVKEVERADGTKRVLYTIDVKERGFCKLLSMKKNWGLIPRIPKGYKVEFIVECGRIKECAD